MADYDGRGLCPSARRLFGGKERALAPPIAAASPDPQLIWGKAVQVPGTQVMRVDLIRESPGLSKGCPEIRNILFLDPAEKAGHWLLPDSRHFVAESLEPPTSADDGKAAKMLGTVALVKEVGENSEASTGRLLVFDPVGRILEAVADDVRRVNVACRSFRRLRDPLRAKPPIRHRGGRWANVQDESRAGA